MMHRVAEREALARIDRDDLRMPGVDHPASREELEGYLYRATSALQEHLGDRLSCVLLFGSWARGEAKPPSSDVDLVVVVDTVDDAALQLLSAAWTAAGIGYANVYGRDEIRTMPRDSWESYSTNARVLVGDNPFTAPSINDLAIDLARQAETIARYGRILVLYPWLSPAECLRDVGILRHKSGIAYGLRCLASVRTGLFPGTRDDVIQALEGTEDLLLLDWLAGLEDDEVVANRTTIGARVQHAARRW